MNSTTELMKNHMSVRKYKNDAVDRQTVDTIVQCAQAASTSSHFQAYTIIEVTSDDGRDVLFAASGEQKWIKSAPLVLLFCGDLHRGSKYYEGTDEGVFGNTECYTVAVVDAALAAQNALLAAESMGLGGVIVGGIRNDVESVCKKFILPDRVFPLFALCIGYADEEPGLKPRLPQEAIHKIDCYDQSQDDVLIGMYDERISAYYCQRTAGKVKDRWTQRCGRLLMSKTRDEVGEYFRKIGLLKK